MKIKKVEKSFKQALTSGFTLIEILVGITLLSLLMLYVYTIVDDSTQTKDRTILEDSQILQVETALNRFRIDFSQIYNPLFMSSRYRNTAESFMENEHGEQIEGKPQFDFEPSERFRDITEKGVPVPNFHSPDRHSLEFMTMSNKRKFQDAKQSKFAWVQYGLRNSTEKDEDEEENQSGQYELIRYYTANNPYAEDHDWLNIKPHVLLRSVKSLEFLVWDESRKKFSKLDTGDNENSIIRGVMIKLIWIDSTNTERKVERTYTPLWPYFDAEKEKKQLELESQKATEEEDEEEEKEHSIK